MFPLLLNYSSCAPVPGSLGQKESHCFSAPLMFLSKHLLMVLQATWLTSCVLFAPPLLSLEKRGLCCFMVLFLHLRVFYFGRESLFALQYSGCYVIMLEKVSQNTMACTQRRRWCFCDAHHQPMEKLNSVRFSPQKMLNKLITPLEQ